MSSIRVITNNVRYDGLRDQPIPIPSKGVITLPRHHHGRIEPQWHERPWAERRSRLVDALAGYEPDVIGFQEVLYNQLLDLEQLLGEDYAHVGVGRDDGYRAGEYSPIFYRRDRFNRVGWQTKWLSLEPDRPGSIGWDAAQTRIATFLTLQDTYQPHHTLVNIINTHYDDQGMQSRGEASLLIREEAKRWVERHEKGGEGLTIWMGDFNADPIERNELGYRNAISPDPLPHHKSGLHFLNTHTHLQLRHSHSPSKRIRQSAPSGPIGTYTDFSEPGKEVDTMIDFVLAATEGKGIRAGWEVARHAVVDNVIAGKGDASGWTGRWSDHRAVFVEFVREG